MFDAFRARAYSRGGLIREGLINYLIHFRIKSSLSKLLFSLILKEQYKCRL